MTGSQQKGTGLLPNWKLNLCLFHRGVPRVRKTELCLESVCSCAAASQTAPYQTTGIAYTTDGGAAEGVGHTDDLTSLVQAGDCLAIGIDYLTLIVHIRGRRQ